MNSIRQVCMFYSEMGGVERSVMDLVEGLNGDYEVDVLCTKKGRGVQLDTVHGVKVTRAGSPVAVVGRPLSRSFFHHLGGTKADIVHYHLPCPLASVAHMTNRPQVKASVATWHHDLQRYPIFNAFQIEVFKHFFNELDFLIATSPILADSVPILARYREKCRIVPLGVDETRFHNVSEENVEQYRRRFGRPFVLFVGRLVYYKGCEVLLKAMTSVDAGLVLVGTGPLEGKLKQLSEDMGLSKRVHFLGRLPDSELADLYRACDLFVLPSTEETECFGLVQVEAMLCEKPVVNTYLPTGVPWVSQDRVTGLTVPPGDVPALAGAISKLLSDTYLSSRLGRSGRERALQHFTLRRQVDATRDLYAELLQK